MLDGRHPVPCESETQWRAWMQSPARRVANTQIEDVQISTVFLGVEHSQDKAGQSMLFETAVSVQDSTRYLERYATWDEAVVGHERIVGHIRETMQQNGVDAVLAWERVMWRHDLVF